MIASPKQSHAVYIIMVVSQMITDMNERFQYIIFVMTENAAEIVGAEGGIQDVLAAMRAFPKELELSSNCCIALWSLSVVGTTKHYVVTIVTTVLGRYSLTYAFESVLKGNCLHTFDWFINAF